jgi:hypothetical protein
MEKIIEQKMCVFMFSITLFEKKNYSKKNPARYGNKFTNVFM